MKTVTPKTPAILGGWGGTSRFDVFFLVEYAAYGLLSLIKRIDDSEVRNFPCKHVAAVVFNIERIVAVRNTIINETGKGVSIWRGSTNPGRSYSWERKPEFRRF
jgi:hypothetical protein